MTEEFINKIKNNEYISNYLYTYIKEQNKEVIPINFNIDEYNDKILNKLYLENYEYFKNMYKGIDDNIILDEEQIKAILREEDYSLIIAGAGTGKTTTMASKVKYLVDKKKVDPNKIIVMSYTRKATQELIDRINGDFNIDANITTFHSLGYSYIREIFNGRKCYVIGEDNRNKIFLNYIKEELFPNKSKLKELIELFPNTKIGSSYTIRKFFLENYEKYETYDEYFNSYKKYKLQNEKNLKEKINKITYARMNGEYIITLKGEIVKSKGEAIIANFLFKNGINYEYEKIFPELLESKKTYKPDFTLNLNGEEVYIEYFGLSNKNYERIKKQKEEYHNLRKTKFIKLEYIENNPIENRLKIALLNMGFILNPLTDEKIYEEILKQTEIYQFKPLENFYYKIIDNIKKSEKREDYVNIIKDYILKQSKEEQNTFIKEFKMIDEYYHYYQKNLYGSQDYGFDFSDMIYYANKYINYVTSHKTDCDYIVIDEYQDISEERYEFTKNISLKNHAKIIAVGDDWQSIYSFAGSKIKYVYNFEKYFKGAKLSKISKTYRNSQELIDRAGIFIMKNDSQIKKELISNKHIESPIKYAVFEKGKEYETLKELILHIHKENPTHHILILGRTNRIINNCFLDPELLDDIDTKITFVGYEDILIDGMTMHKSKGLTSDEVILIGLNNYFPSNGYETYWMNKLFQSKLLEEKIPYAEERRLFYVALTRTKNYVYLLLNENKEERSPFINEIENIINLIEYKVKDIV